MGKARKRAPSGTGRQGSGRPQLRDSADQMSGIDRPDSFLLRAFDGASEVVPPNCARDSRSRLPRGGGAFEEALRWPPCTPTLAVAVWLLTRDPHPVSPVPPLLDGSVEYLPQMPTALRSSTNDDSG